MRSGFVALAGRPNTGKSTLLNQILRRKVSIVSDKPQTTRTQVRGVLTRDGLQIVGSAAETEAIAATVDGTDGVVFVPALTGLGAPHWDPHARGTILGITRGTTRAHIVRATLEAITFEVRDVTDTMPTGLTSMMVDGGASANDLLCQLQADLLGVPVHRPEFVETTALGAAFMAGLGTGVWGSTDDLRETWQLERAFEPAADRAKADAGHARWLEAVERSKAWA